MKHLKSYKIFESNEDALDIRQDIMYILLPLIEYGIDVYIDVYAEAHTGNPAEALIEVIIENPEDLNEFLPEFKQLFSFVEDEGWSLIPTKYADPSYCEVSENPNFVCPQCGSEEVDLEIDDDFTTRCNDCSYEGDRDEFRSYYKPFNDLDTLLTLIEEGVDRITINFYKLK